MDMTSPQTPGEQLFEQYLQLYGYEFRHEEGQSEKRKNPDYSVVRNGTSILCEVKDFEPKMFPEGEVTWDAYKGIRERINAASKQFKEYKDRVCCLVLHNQGDQYVDLTTPMTVLGSMYGNAGMQFPLQLNPGKPVAKPKFAFLAHGKMLRPKTNQPQNTTFSALVTIHQVNLGRMRLRRYLENRPDFRDEDILKLTNEKVGFDLEERRLGVIVWENAVAAHPLPKGIFDGPYDVRWGMVDGGQAIMYRGAELPEGVSVE
jgi:hypothetical protein